MSSRFLSSAAIALFLLLSNTVSNCARFSCTKKPSWNWRRCQCAQGIIGLQDEIVAKRLRHWEAVKWVKVSALKIVFLTISALCGGSEIRALVVSKSAPSTLTVGLHQLGSSWIDDSAISLQGMNEHLSVCQQLFLIPGQKKNIMQVVLNLETLPAKWTQHGNYNFCEHPQRCA